MVRLVLIDLSGTLHVGKKAIPGSPAALERLEAWAKKNNCAIRFLSNTTKESKSSLVSTLQQLAFKTVRPDRVLTPLQAAKDTLSKVGSANPICFLSDSAIAELGFDKHDGEHDGVIVGLHLSSFTYDKLNEAFRLLKNRNVPFVAAHRGRYYKDESDQLSMGPGAFVAALEESSGRKAVTVGKPSVGFFQAALQQAELELGSKITPEEVVMVGDDVRDDIKGARDMGFKGVLVRTGKFKPEDEAGVEFCVPSFVEFVTGLEQGIFITKDSASRSRSAL